MNLIPEHNATFNWIYMPSILWDNNLMSAIHSPGTISINNILHWKHWIYHDNARFTNWTNNASREYGKWLLNIPPRDFMCVTGIHIIRSSWSHIYIFTVSIVTLFASAHIPPHKYTSHWIYFINHLIGSTNSRCSLQCSFNVYSVRLMIYFNNELMSFASNSIQSFIFITYNLKTIDKPALTTLHFQLFLI